MKKFKKLLSAVLALTASFSMLSVTPVSAEKTNVLKYEFEDGSTSGGKIHANGASDVKTKDFPENTDFSGYSGKGFSYLD